MGNHQQKEQNFLMALHSSSEDLGVAILDICDPSKKISSKIFPLGKQLSTKLISCVEEIIPASKWKQLVRIAVAIGPGGFTGTRLTVVMARTLAQQINCSVDGISSFQLMAYRLSRQLSSEQLKKPFWIIKELPRRGIVAGKYKIEKKSDFQDFENICELKLPYLINNNIEFSPSICAQENVEEDVIRLLNICKSRHESGTKSEWAEVLPIYPTSPVNNY